MRVFLLLVLALLVTPSLHLPVKLAPVTTFMQENCADAFPKEMKTRAFAQSFICGQNISDREARELFQKTGLLHLMVVSGSHLQILSLLILLPWPKKWRERRGLQLILWTLLFFYCLLTGFQPPLVRAFFSRLISAASQKLHWHWDLGKVQIFSGLFILILIPEWILSFSFYLSWLASVGFLATPLYQKSKKFQFVKNALNCLFIQAFMSVSFLQFSLLSFLMNCLFAPLIGIFLFPLSGAVLLFPFLVPAADWGWEKLIQFLSLVSNFSSAFPSEFLKLTSSRWIFLWIFLAATHCFFEALRQWRYQRTHV